MPGLQIYTSNRLETLAHQASQVLKEPLASALSPEVIVVQSRGMERWLSLELADQLGIWANFEYPFPNAFLDSVASKVLPNPVDTTSYDPACLTFRIMNLLPARLRSSKFKTVQNYLADDPDGLKLFQLAYKTADLFDQYLVFRPEMILAWEAGQESHWQAVLWRSLMSDDTTGIHRARQHHRLMCRLESGDADTVELPERVTVFGVSQLPPLHVQVLVALARYIQINFFILNPCRLFWADIVSKQDIARIKKARPSVKQPMADLYLEPGNRLLASMGKLGRDFLQIVTSIESEQTETFEVPDRSSLLGAVQNDILELRDIQSVGLPPGESQKWAPDCSIQVHACHSPMREIEVLHDQILGMFDDDPDLKPQDIIVMATDIEAYAPYIRAVFDAQTDDRLRIPFTVADQSAKQKSRIAEAFFEILALKESRMGVNQVMALLEYPVVRSRFDLNREDVNLIESWLLKTGVRWGIDAESRAQMNLPATDQNTWRAGLNRMLLGYAMQGGNTYLFNGLLPLDDIEGQSARTLGKFIDFVETVFKCAQSLRHRCQLTTWAALLNGLLEDFFDPTSGSEQEIQVLRDTFSILARINTYASFNHQVSLEVIKDLIDRQLRNNTTGTNFITSGVTFCAMLPMRSIPKAVICLIGMNSNAFPRQTQSLSFDIMAKAPRRGDRSRRDDDKYLFLEAIISARKKLYVSYIGQSILDNSKIPPSVLVSELCDYIKNGYGVADNDLITVHRLQSFAPAYFRETSAEEGLFSFSVDDCQAADLLYAHREARYVFTTPLSEFRETSKTIDLDQMITFFNHPARYILQNRLGVRIQSETDTLDEREPFHLHALAAYQIGNALVQKQIAGDDLNALMPAYLQHGTLPHGSQAEISLNKLKSSAEAFYESIQQYREGEAIEPMPIEINLDERRLTGLLVDRYTSGIIKVRYGRTRGKDLMALWICHLVQAAAGRTIEPKESRLVCRDNIWGLAPVLAPDNALFTLTDLFHRGMCRPIHYFPESSYQYARSKYLLGRSETQALKAARRAWQGNDFTQTRAESKDPYFDICFRYIDPIDDAFQEHTRAVWQPLFQHLYEIV